MRRGGDDKRPQHRSRHIASASRMVGVIFFSREFHSNLELLNLRTNEIKWRSETLTVRLGLHLNVSIAIAECKR
jgi:hypothetical protein